MSGWRHSLARSWREKLPWPLAMLVSLKIELHPWAVPPLSSPFERIHLTHVLIGMQSLTSSSHRPDEDCLLALGINGKSFTVDTFRRFHLVVVGNSLVELYALGPWLPCSLVSPPSSTRRKVGVVQNQIHAWSKITITVLRFRLLFGGLQFGAHGLKPVGQSRDAIKGPLVSKRSMSHSKPYVVNTLSSRQWISSDLSAQPAKRYQSIQIIRLWLSPNLKNQVITP